MASPSCKSASLKYWLSMKMAWTEVDVGNRRGRDGLVFETDCIKGMRSLSNAADSTTQPNPVGNKFEGKDALSFTNILSSRNKFGDALVLYNIVLEKKRDNLEALVGKGVFLQAQNLNQQAFESLMEVIKLDPQNACALTHCGVLYKDEGHLLKAVESYQKALKVDPSYRLNYTRNTLCYNWRYADAMYNLGITYGEMLKFDISIVFYELALHFNPHCAEACNNLGVIYKDRDNLDKAVECYQMALFIKPNFTQSLNNLEVVYTIQGKFDAAAGMIEKAIVANPLYAEAYNNLGKAPSASYSVYSHHTSCLQCVAMGSPPPARVPPPPLRRGHSTTVASPPFQPVPPFLARRRPDDRLPAVLTPADLLALLPRCADPSGHPDFVPVVLTPTVLPDSVVTDLTTFSTTVLTPVDTRRYRDQDLCAASTSSFRRYYHIQTVRGSFGSATIGLDQTSRRFLDKAALKSNNSDSLWKLCPVTQVEETKQMIKLLPIFFCDNQVKCHDFLSAISVC